MSGQVGSAKMALKLLAHEAFHAGVNGKGGRASRQLLNKVYKEIARRKSSDPLKSLLNMIVKDYEYNLTKPADRITAAEEVVAHLSEGNWMTEDRSLWEKIKVEVKRIIAKFSGDQETLNKLSNEDILDIVRGVRSGLHARVTETTGGGIRLSRDGSREVYRMVETAFEEGVTLGEFIDRHPDIPPADLLKAWARVQRNMSAKAAENFNEKEDPEGRPDLAQIVSDEEAQRAVRNVDEERRQTGTPERRAS